MVTPADIKALFPEFASESDLRIQLFLDQAAFSVNASVWGNKADFAIQYLTGHLLTVANRGGSGAAGPVTSEKVGDLQRSYANNVSAVAHELGSTGYGMEFLRLRRSLYITPRVL
jgi:hypothetical protein